MMWEYELFMQYLNDAVKEENDEQKKEMSKFNINDYNKKIQNHKQFQPPKMPSIPKYQ